MEKTQHSTNRADTPLKATNRDLFFRTATGTIGGLSGTVVLLICFILLTALFRGVQVESAATNPIVLFGLLFSVFMATLCANISGAALVFLFNRDKYQKLMTTLGQVFILNVMVFFFMIPVYMFINDSSVYTLIYPMGLHMLLSTYLSAVIQEVISNYRYFMVGMYGLTAGMLLVFVGGLSFAFGASNTAAQTQLFLSGFVIVFPPLLWGSMMFCETLGEMIYHYIYTIFGVDFLGEVALEEVEEEDARDND